MSTPGVRAVDATIGETIAKALKTPGVAVDGPSGSDAFTVKAVYLEDVMDAMKTEGAFCDEFFKGDEDFKSSRMKSVATSFGFKSRFESLPDDSTLRLISCADGARSPQPFTRDIVIDVQEPSPSPPAARGTIPSLASVSSFAYFSHPPACGPQPIPAVVTLAEASRMQAKLPGLLEDDASLRNVMYDVSAAMQACVHTLKTDTHGDRDQVAAQNRALAVAEGRCDGRYNARSSLLIGKRCRRLFEEGNDENNVNSSAVSRVGPYLWSGPYL